jgi:hypothetical protein
MINAGADIFVLKTGSVEPILKAMTQIISSQGDTDISPGEPLNLFDQTETGDSTTNHGTSRIGRCRDNASGRSRGLPAQS